MGVASECGMHTELGGREAGRGIREQQDKGETCGDALSCRSMRWIRFAVSAPVTGAGIGKGGGREEGRKEARSRG